MGYKINGEVIISNSKDIDNVGIATMDLVDAKVSAKAITEQTEGAVSDVTGADEVLIYDAEGGTLLRVTVDEFISGSGIGTLVSDFDSLNVTGIVTAGGSFDGNLFGNTTGLHNGDVYSRTGAEIVLEVPLDTGTGSIKANLTGETVSVSSSVTAANLYGTVTGNVTGNSTGLHNGDVYSRDGSQLVLEVPATTGDAHYIGTVTGDVTGDTTGTHYGTNTGQNNGDVYTNDGGQQVVDTAASPSPVFTGDAEGLTGTPNISVGNVSASSSVTAAAVYSGDIAARNIITLGITTIQDHLEVNDSTGSGTEYNLNVKTNGSSTFGVLGNGNILLGNSSAAPFMATNDHHATSKKFVDDAIGLSTVGLASTEYVDQAVASAGGEWTLTGTNLAPNSSSTNVVVDSSIGIGTTATSGARVTVVNEMSENLSYLPVVSVRQNDSGEENNIQEWRFYNDHPLRLYAESSNDYNLGLVQFGGDDPTAKSYMKFHGDGFSGITFHAGTTNGSASQVFSMNAFGQVRDKIGSIRGFGSPITKSSDYTPDSGDEGYLIEFTSGNATVSYDGGFNEGCGFHIVNNSSSSMSIIQGAGNTMYFTEDGTTGNRTLGARGLARVFYMDSSWWIDGSGLS